MSSKNSVLARAAFFMEEQKKLKITSPLKKPQRKQLPRTELSPSLIQEKTMTTNSASTKTKSKSSVGASRSYFAQRQQEAKKIQTSHAKKDYKKGSIKDRLAMFQNIDQTAQEDERSRRKEWKRAKKRRERAQTKTAEFARKLEQMSDEQKKMEEEAKKTETSR